MRLRRSPLGLVILLATGCSSESGGDAVTSFTPGVSAPASMQPGAPGAPAESTPPSATTGGTSGAPATSPGASANEGAQGPVALDPETPVAGNEGATGGTSPVDAGVVVVVPSDPPPGDPTFPLPVTPSAGCASGNTTQGAASMTIRGAQADYTVRLPQGYSPSTPTPLVFAFHGRNRTHVDLETVDATQIATTIGAGRIMVYPKSQGGPGWNFDEEVPPSIEFFDALYAQMTQNYCVDTSKVFAVGHSSGGYFSIILACRYGALLRGIGSVSGALQEQMCSSDRVAGMFIHGAADRVVANSGGRAARDQLIARDGCGQNTVPGDVAPCVAYQGCPEGFPIQWCEHTEPTYSDANGPTNHGWPSFASQAIGRFFDGLP
jgi:poly(3-hydroxybutyrate) depolymerase